jgi:hypothetical protein
MDKYFVIGALTVLGLGALYVVPDQAHDLLKDIFLILGSLASGHAMGVQAEKKRG